MFELKDIGYFTSFAYAEGNLIIKFQHKEVVRTPFPDRKSAFEFVKEKRAKILFRLYAILKEKNMLARA